MYDTGIRPRQDDGKPFFVCQADPWRCIVHILFSGDLNVRRPIALHRRRIHAGRRTPASRTSSTPPPTRCSASFRTPPGPTSTARSPRHSAPSTSWRKTSPMERVAILRKVAELSRERAKDIGRNMTLDQGKPLAEAVGEVMACAEHAEWHAEECRRIYGRVIPPRQPERAPDGAARADRRVRRVHAVEFPVQPGDPQDRRRARRRLHDHHQGAGGFAQRGGRDRAHVPRRRPAARLPQHRVGRADRDFRRTSSSRRSCARSRSPVRCRWASSSPRWPART